MMISPSEHLSLQTRPPGPLDCVMKRMGAEELDVPSLSAAALGPCGPGAPAGPGGPNGPAGPCGPAGPVAPAIPCGPAGPGGPETPCFPSGPGGPAMPTAPAAPCSPFGPGGPAGPSKQPPSDNAKPQARVDIKMRILMLPPPHVLNFLAVQSEAR